MNARDLTVSKSINLNGAREFNHLRLVNLDDFLMEYGNNLEYYAPPFKILADLEKEIMFENNPEQTILVPYKPDGDIIFRLVGIEEEGGLRIVRYEYDSSIS